MKKNKQSKNPIKISGSAKSIDNFIKELEEWYKEETAFERLKAIQKVGTTTIIPWEVWHILGADSQAIEIISYDQIGFGKDFASLEEAREAVNWYVKQLGGTVKWEN